MKEVNGNTDILIHALKSKQLTFNALTMYLNRVGRVGYARPTDPRISEPRLAQHFQKTVVNKAPKELFMDTCFNKRSIHVGGS